MDIGVVVLLVTLSAGVVSLSKLLLNPLRRRLGRDISVKPIYLRSYDNFPEGLLKLKISNDSGHKVTINCISLVEVNGKEVVQVGIPKPFEIENKNGENGDIEWKFYFERTQKMGFSGTFLPATP